MAKITPHVRHQSGNLSPGSSSHLFLLSSPISSLFSLLLSVFYPLSSLLSHHPLLFSREERRGEETPLSSLLSSLFLLLPVDARTKRKAKSDDRSALRGQDPPIPATVDTFETRRPNASPKVTTATIFDSQKCATLANACECLRTLAGALRMLCEGLRTQTQLLLVASWTPGPQL